MRGLATWMSFTLLLKYISAQSTTVTYTSAAEVSLPCAITGDTVSATWNEDVTGASTDVTIYSLVNGNIQDNRGSEDKYVNFNADLNSTTFSIVINTVAADDGGTYICTIVSGISREGGQILQILRVEVPGKVTITDDSDDAIDVMDVTVGGTYPVTCGAREARSVNDLVLTWNPATGNTTEASNPSSDGETLLNYTSTLHYEPQKDHTNITCTLGGFENQIPLAKITDTVTLNVRYRPECTLDASSDAEDCTMVTLTCICDAEPAVDSYEFHQDSVQIVGTSGNTATASVVTDQETAFSCRASNTIDGDPEFGVLANLEEDYVCNLQAGCGTAGLIIGWVFATVLVVALIIVTLYYRRKETPSNHSKENGQKSNVAPQGRTSADNSAYMDLKDRDKTEERSDLPGEIPEGNVNILSDFQSRGFMVYRKVNIVRSLRRENAVAKSLSDTASIALLKLWYSEIKSVLNLPKQHNVVEVIGWCNAVPNILLTELVNGGNLLQHLSDNFGPRKLHLYGNTKRKKFEVPEKGNPDKLPEYALDVSRGLRFLLVNKFIHPGLRAEKVLLDSAGRCKLYDIVSMVRAKEITSLRWRESVPYQWMSPEYLNLGTMSLAGDIWSFGVLLWEMFSYGSQPYPGEDRVAVANSLRRSDRLSMPQNCPGAIWQLMIQCWEQSPEMRPKLDEITSKLSIMCNDKKQYEEIPDQRPLV